MAPNLRTETIRLMKVAFFLLLVLSGDAGMMRMKEKVLENDVQPADLLKNRDLPKYIEHTVQRLKTGQIPGFKLYSQHFNMSRSASEGKEGAVAKRELTFATVCLISVIVLAVTRLAANAYSTSLNQFTGETLTELGEQLRTQLSAIKANLNSLTTLVESRKKNWAATADKIRVLLDEMEEDISEPLDLYLQNMFPATSHSQAADFQSPNPIVTDLNADNFESILDTVYSDLEAELSDTVVGATLTSVTEGIIHALGYFGLEAAMHGIGIPLIGLLSSLYKTGQTVWALTNQVSACTNKLKWTQDELQILVNDANFEFCSLFRSIRVFSRVHQNIHAYILQGGEVEPPPQLLSLWDTLGLSVDFYVDELDAMWDRGWCPKTDTRSSDTIDCLQQGPTRDAYMCAVQTTWVDDFVDPGNWRLDGISDITNTNVSTTKSGGNVRALFSDKVPVPARGVLRFGNEEEEKYVSPITSFVQVNPASSIDFKDMSIYGLFKQRTFFPTPDLFMVNERLQAYNWREYTDPYAYQRPVDFMQTPKYPSNDYTTQLNLLASRSSGAPVVDIKLCDPDKLEPGWYQVPLAATDAGDMCPSGYTISEEYFLYASRFLCYKKDWSMVYEITDGETAEAEKIFYAWILQSSSFDDTM